MDDVRPPFPQPPEPDLGRDPAQCRETQGIVRPIDTFGTRIRIAWAIKEMRRIDEQQVEACLLYTSRCV